MTVLLALGSLRPALSGSPCPSEVYAGFDSRLTPRLLAVLPKPETQLVDVAIRDGRPVVLGEKRLLVLGADAKWAAMPIFEGARGLVIDADGAVQIATGKRLIVLSPEGREEHLIDSTLTTRTGKRALPPAIEVHRLTNGQYEIHAVARAGSRFKIASLPSEPVAVGWNGAGLSFVSSETLWTWKPDEKELRPLASDRGFATAKATCLLPDGRAIVGLAHSTFAISAEYGVAIAGFGSFCDADGDRIGLLDPDAGVFWGIEGLGDVGNPVADRAYAERLARGELDVGRPAISRVAEAVRIVGCPTVEAWLK